AARALIIPKRHCAHPGWGAHAPRVPSSVPSPKILRCPQPRVVFVLANDARIPRISSNVMKLLLQIPLPTDQPIKRPPFPDGALCRGSLVNSVCTGRFNALENLGQRPKHCFSATVLFLHLRFKEQVNMIRHHTGDV